MRILLLDEQAATRGALRRVFEAEDDMRVVAEATGVESALRSAQTLRPDLLVVEAHMNPIYEYDLMRGAADQIPEARAVLLAGCACVCDARALAARGICGYLGADAPLDEVVSALRVVHGGGMYLRGTPTPPTRPGPSFSPDPPTRRELELVLLVDQGQSNSEIARRLGITERTVHAHIRHLFEKACAGSRGELAYIARQLRWVPKD